ncbi:MAG: hypothetical protein KGJ15_08445, partial [Betaproteobacteria bacterium]|nr:hypothetical protein [Betaproteobacteria bacterium]
GENHHVAQGQQGKLDDVLIVFEKRGHGEIPVKLSYTAYVGPVSAISMETGVSRPQTPATLCWSA